MTTIAACRAGALPGRRSRRGRHAAHDDHAARAGRAAVGSVRRCRRQCRPRAGAGPGAGGRIVVEAAQLGAIARQFGVDWRPASSADRAVLDRPGRPLRREDVLDAVQQRADRRRRVGRLRHRAGRLHAAAGAVRGRSAAGGVRSRLRCQRRPVQRDAVGHRRGDGTDRICASPAGWTTRSNCRSPPRGCPPAACCAPRTCTWRASHVAWCVARWCAGPAMPSACS